MLLRKFPDQEQFQELAKTHNVIPVGVEILAISTSFSTVSFVTREDQADRAVAEEEADAGTGGWD